MKKKFIIIYLFLFIFSLSSDVCKNENFSTIQIVKRSYASNGSYILSYSVKPDMYTEDITYSLSSSNTSLVVSNYYSVDLDTSEDQVTITNLSACGYTCYLKLYAVDDPDVNAVVTLDYQKRVSGVSAYFDGDESKVTFTSSVRYGIGSVSPSYSVEDESLTFNSTFVTKVKSILTPTTTTTSSYSGLIYYGFSGDKSTYLNDFSLYSLTYNLYSKYTSQEIIRGSLVTSSVTKRLSSFSGTTDYEELFLGYFPTFDYIGYVNGVSYSRSLYVQVLRD